jgi:hypothetical protein
VNTEALESRTKKLKKMTEEEQAAYFRLSPAERFQFSVEDKENERTQFFKNILKEHERLAKDVMDAFKELEGEDGQPKSLSPRSPRQ